MCIYSSFDSLTLCTLANHTILYTSSGCTYILVYIIEQIIERMHTIIHSVYYRVTRYYTRLVRVRLEYSIVRL